MYPQCVVSPWPPSELAFCKGSLATGQSSLSPWSSPRAPPGVQGRDAGPGVGAQDGWGSTGQPRPEAGVQDSWWSLPGTACPLVQLRIQVCIRPCALRGSGATPTRGQAGLTHTQTHSSEQKPGLRS